MTSTVRPESKIIVIVREDLAVWQKLNIACFLAGGLGGADPQLVGQPYQDASGTLYHPLIRQPILIYAGTGEELRLAHRRALDREVRVAVYTMELFATSNDDDNRKAVRDVVCDTLDLVGLAFHTDRRLADKIVKGLKWHP
ncbi:MAG: DUF2000 family protein [Bdellovibrionales bacterium]